MTCSKLFWDDLDKILLVREVSFLFLWGFISIKLFYFAKLTASLRAEKWSWCEVVILLWIKLSTIILIGVGFWEFRLPVDGCCLRSPFDIFKSVCCKIPTFTGEVYSLSNWGIMRLGTKDSTLSKLRRLSLVKVGEIVLLLLWWEPRDTEALDL